MKKSYPHRTRNVCTFLYPFSVTGEPVCSYSPFKRFQPDAPRWVLYFPSAASQLRQLSVLQSIYTIPFLCICLYLYVSLIRSQFNTSTWFCQGIFVNFENHKKIVEFFFIYCYNKDRCGVWRSLVARTAGGREVAGSNPVAPIFWLLLLSLIIISAFPSMKLYQTYNIVHSLLLCVQEEKRLTPLKVTA